MKDLKIFENAEFGAIRTAGTAEEPLFCLADVCRVLELYVQNTKKRLKEDGVYSIPLTDSLGREQQALFINEQNLYKVIMRSDKPQAEAFQDWVCGEVLPSIRKSGGYINNVDLVVDAYFSDIPDDQKALVKNMLNSIEQKQKRISSLTNQNVVLAKENDILVQRNLEWADRALINALVRAYAHTLNDDYSTAWNNFKKELLYKHSININSRITHHLNTSGKKTKPKTLEMLYDDEVPNALSTIVAMCRESNADIDDLLANTAVG